MVHDSLSVYVAGRGRDAGKTPDEQKSKHFKDPLLCLCNFFDRNKAKSFKSSGQLLFGITCAHSFHAMYRIGMQVWVFGSC